MKYSIGDKIQAKTPGCVFSASDFKGLAPRNNIDQALARLRKKGEIRQIATGLFSRPIKHKRFGEVPPDVDVIAQAYAKKLGYKIQTNPAKAANLIGLSDQVPSQHCYLTDGPNKVLKIDNMIVVFKHACPRKLVGFKTKSGLIIQALYYLGQKGITETTIQKIKKIVDKNDKKKLLNLSKLTPTWIQKVIIEAVQDA